MDLVARAPHVPAPGETVLGRDFSTIPGGKGANQAVAVARLGAASRMIGRVGDDDFGRRLLDGLAASGVDTDAVRITPHTPSGIAMIVVEDAGENAITVASGANFQVTPDDVDAAETLLRRAAICLIQLELPVATVCHTIRVCRRHGVQTLLDPAPAPQDEIPDELFQADIISPNESEAAILTGLPARSDPSAIAEALHRRGCSSVVLKLGERGAWVSAGSQRGPVPGFRIDAVDTTAAGDAFTAALAVCLAAGQNLLTASRFANAAGALACTRLGAQLSMPTREEVEGLLGHPS
jgi:ribokinase